VASPAGPIQQTLPLHRTLSFFKQHNIAQGLLLVGMTWAVYARGCGFDFVDFDDLACVMNNPQVRAGLTPGGVRWAFSTLYFANWMPLTWLSYMLDATLYGDWAGGFHLTNLLLHTASVLLLFASFAHMTRDVTRSAFLAALFAIHPLNVESVAWIAERKGILSMFFGLLSLYAYIRYAQRPRRATIFLSLIFFLCSLASKQTFVTLPCLFLLLDFWPLGRLSDDSGAETSDDPRAPPRQEAEANAPWDREIRPLVLGRARRLVMEKVPFFLASAAFSVVATMAQSSGEAVLEGIPFHIRLLNMLLAYGLALRRAILPFHLAPFYRYEGMQVSLVGAGLSLVALVVLSYLAIRNLRRLPFLLVGWLWFLGTLLPMSGIVQIGGQQMADRYTYLPAIGLFLAVAWLIPSPLPNPLARARVLQRLAMAIVALYSVIAFLQVGYWSDGLALFDHTLAVTEDNLFVHQMLASALFHRGRFQESLDHSRLAEKFDPRDPGNHYIAARALHALGKLDESELEYKKVLSIKEAAPAHNALGLVLSLQRRYPEAKRQFERAIEMDPGFVDAYANLGSMYGQMGEYGKCISYSKQALAINPRLVGCDRNIALSLAAQGRLDEAIDRMRYVLSVTPDDQVTQKELSRLISRKAQGVVPTTP
jgi:protein O-mannosyl-transferase